jgi:hypothetical protein
MTTRYKAVETDNDLQKIWIAKQRRGRLRRKGEKLEGYLQRGGGRGVEGKEGQ